MQKVRARAKLSHSFSSITEAPNQPTAQVNRAQAAMKIIAMVVSEPAASPAGSPGAA